MRLGDACELLGIPLSASREDAQRAYRKCALRHHPDRNPDDPSATSKFQSIGEAWDRVRQYHDNPRRWGVHADVDDSFEATAASHTNADFGATWEDLFNRWFSGSQWDYEPKPEPRHKATCNCEVCAAERRREEIFAERARAREKRREEAAKQFAAAQVRAKEEAARTMQERVREAELAQSRRERERAELDARCKRHLAALRSLLSSAVDLSAPLDELLESFSALKTAVEKVEQQAQAQASDGAGKHCKHAPGAGSGREAVGVDPVPESVVCRWQVEASALVAQAERRLDAIGEAAEMAAAAAPAIDAEMGVANDAANAAVMSAQAGVAVGSASGARCSCDSRDVAAAAHPEHPKSGGESDRRKQRKPAQARGAELRAIEALVAARTAEELEEAIERGDKIRKASPDLVEAIEKASEQLARFVPYH